MSSSIESSELVTKPVPMVLSWLNEEVLYPEEDDDSAWEQLCAESKATDFYVHVSTKEYVINYPTKAVGVETRITLCPKVFFDAHGYLLDRTPRIRHLLPAHWQVGTATDAVLCISGKETSMAVVHAKLTELGFQTTGAMSDYLIGLPQ